MKKSKRIVFYVVTIILSSIILVKVSSCGFKNPNQSDSIYEESNNSIITSSENDSSSHSISNEISSSEEFIDSSKMMFKTNVTFEGIDLNYLTSLLNYSSQIENEILATYRFGGKEFDYTFKNITDETGYKTITLSLDDKEIVYQSVFLDSYEKWKIISCELESLTFEYDSQIIKNNLYFIDLAPLLTSNLIANLNEYPLTEYTITDTNCNFSVSIPNTLYRLNLSFPIPSEFNFEKYQEETFLTLWQEENFVYFSCIEENISSFTVISLEEVISVSGVFICDYYLKGNEEIVVEKSDIVLIQYECEDLQNFKMHLKPSSSEVIG